MELDKQVIERTDFAAVRRGYDPGEVDRHLGEISKAVDELKRASKKDQEAASRQSSEGAGSIAGVAASQVRTIVEAAERSAAEIETHASEEADRVTAEAKQQAEQERNTARGEAERMRREAETAARESRQRAEGEASEHVAKVQEATSEMRERANTVESDLEGLVDQLRGTIVALVESVRTSAGSLEVELGGISAGAATVRGAAPASAPPVEPDEQEPLLEDGADAPPAADEELEVEEPDAELEFEEPEAAYDEPIAVEEPEADEPPAGGGNGAEGARLIALNMALNGTPREETARYLEENFDLNDQEAILDEVYARVGG